MDHLTRAYTYCEVQLSHAFSTLQLGLIGSVGALVAFLLRKKNKDMSTLLTFLVVGGLITQFTVRWISRGLNIDPENVGSFAFILGAFGGALFTAFFKAIEELDLANFIKDLIRAKFGVKEPPTPPGAQPGMGEEP
jgi:hypothetical protein